MLNKIITFINKTLYDILSFSFFKKDNDFKDLYIDGKLILTKRDIKWCLFPFELCLHSFIMGCFSAGLYYELYLRFKDISWGLFVVAFVVTLMSIIDNHIRENRKI